MGGVVNNMMAQTSRPNRVTWGKIIGVLAQDLAALDSAANDERVAAPRVIGAEPVA